MAGSAPTFGFQKIGTGSRAAEQLLKDWISNESIPDTEGYNELGKLIGQLNTSESESSMPANNSLVRDEKVRDENLIYILDQDEVFSSILLTPLQQFDYKVKLFTNCEQLQQAISNTMPTILIAEMPEAGCKLQEILVNHRLGDIEDDDYLPVILISNQDDIKTRLEAVRHGGDAFVTFPFDPAHVIDLLDHLMDKHLQEQYRILIVDDDEELATHYQLTLQQAGMEAFTVTDPTNILVALSDKRPDLIMMDLYMPNCTGIELAKIIRQQDAYLSIPIVYLSSEQNPEKQ